MSGRKPPQYSRLCGVAGAALLALASLSPYLGPSVPGFVAALAACAGSVAIAAGFYGTRTPFSLEIPIEPNRAPTLEPLTPPPPPAVTAQGNGAPCRVRDWLEVREAEACAGTSFDQFAREILGATIGAEGVRCYRVDADSNSLRPFTPNVREGQVPLHDGLLGHVAVTGRPYWESSPAAGPILRQLARDPSREWVWAWPIRSGGCVVAVIAATRITCASESTIQEVGALLEIAFRCACAEDGLQAARRTDGVTGVLTRADFFRQADAAVRGAGEQNVPVSILALSIEGVRGMDDGGRWQDRDNVVSEVGGLIRSLVRTDDLIGRFSDDRFVLLLRRIDGGLARLIAEKLESGIRGLLDENGGPTMRARIGIAAGGLRNRPLKELMTAALSASDEARRRGLAILSEHAAADTTERR